MSCCNLRAALRLAVHAAGAPLRSRPGLLLGARSGGGVRLQQLARVRPAFLVRQGLSARPLHVCRAAEDDNAVAQQGSASDSPEAAAPAAEAGGAAAEAAEKPTEKPSPFAALGVCQYFNRHVLTGLPSLSALPAVPHGSPPLPAAPREDRAQAARPRGGAPHCRAGAQKSQFAAAASPCQGRPTNSGPTRPPRAPERSPLPSPPSSPGPTPPFRPARAPARP